MKNMELSLKRAYAVASYFQYTSYDKQYSPALEKIMLVEGCSYSKPILDEEGNEDLQKSRRVELKLVTATKDIPDMLSAFKAPATN